MTHTQIKGFAKLIPISNPYFDSVRGDVSSMQSSQAVSIIKADRAYSDLQFGWNFIKYLAGLKDTHNAFVSDNEYLTRAYNFERYGVEDEDIMMAVLYTLPSRRHFAAALKSSLLIEDVTFEGISEKMGIPVGTVKAFEQLFFNILDRAEESLWLANVVYPEGRLVETLNDYHKNESLSMLLQRSGYNNGMDSVEYFAGLRSNQLTSGDMANASAKMENAIMINGFLLATNGFINQRDAPGINSAKAIINAEKQGGTQNEQQDDFTGSLSDSIFTELDRYKEGETRQLLANRKQIGTLN